MASHTPQPLTLTHYATLTLLLPLLLIKSTLHFLAHLPRPTSTNPLDTKPWLTAIKLQFIKSIARNAIAIPLPIAQALQRPTGDTVRRYVEQHKLGARYDVLELRLEEQGCMDARVHLLRLESESASSSALTSSTSPTSTSTSTSTSTVTSSNNSIPKNKNKIVLYLHGGGFVHALSPTHIPWSTFLARTANADLAILEYTIAPPGAYPTQLAQAVAAINTLTATRYAPESIIIAGDSAGGNIALGLAAHSVKPCPGMQKLSLQGKHAKLGGILALSPRCSTNTSTPSYHAHDASDIVGSHSMPIFNRAWRPRREIWAESALGVDDETRTHQREEKDEKDEKNGKNENGKDGNEINDLHRNFWAADIPVARICIVMGASEVYVHDARRVARALRAKGAVDAGSEVEGRYYIEAPGECHVQAGLEFALGMETGTGLRGCVEFLRGF